MSRTAAMIAASILALACPRGVPASQNPAPLSISAADLGLATLGPIPDGPSPRPRGVGRGRYGADQSPEEWEQRRVHLLGGYAWPWSFDRGWRAAPGWGIGFTRAVAPWGDVVLDFEHYVSRYDRSALEKRGAGGIIVDGNANIRDFGSGVRFHAPRLGRRFYGALGMSFPWVSRPAVRYTDASGAHEVAGNDAGFTFGPVLAAGFEHATAETFGGSIEGRWMIAPGGATPTEHVFIVRAGLSLVLGSR